MQALSQLSYGPMMCPPVAVRAGRITIAGRRAWSSRGYRVPVGWSDVRAGSTVAKRRTLHDEYFKRAKREGYLARSAYKLLEIQERKRVLRRGDRVLDLGCAPGSWLQVAEELVGSGGAVVGVDLTPVRGEFGPNVRTVEGDVFEVEPGDLLPAGGRFDVVLSDMAPATAGDVSDHFRSVELCERVLDLAPGVLKPGGNVIMKVFEGEAYPALLRRASGLFRECKGYKPRATREVSREMYVIGSGFRAGAANGPDG